MLENLQWTSRYKACLYRLPSWPPGKHRTNLLVGPTTKVTEEYFGSSLQTWTRLVKEVTLYLIKGYGGLIVGHEATRTIPMAHDKHKNAGDVTKNGRLAHFAEIVQCVLAAEVPPCLHLIPHLLEHVF